MGSLYPHQFEGRSQQNLTLAHQQQLLLASAAAPPVAHGSGSRAWGAVFKQLLLQTHATPPDPLVESCQQQPECGDRDTDPSLLRWESECKRKQDCLSDERRVSSTSSTTAGMSLLSALLQDEWAAARAHFPTSVSFHTGSAALTRTPPAATAAAAGAPIFHHRATGAAMLSNASPRQRHIASSHVAPRHHHHPSASSTTNVADFDRHHSLVSTDAAPAPTSLSRRRRHHHATTSSIGVKRRRCAAAHRPFGDYSSSASHCGVRGVVQEQPPTPQGAVAVAGSPDSICAAAPYPHPTLSNKRPKTSRHHHDHHTPSLSTLRAARRHCHMPRSNHNRLTATTAFVAEGGDDSAPSSSLSSVASSHHRPSPVVLRSSHALTHAHAHAAFPSSPSVVEVSPPPLSVSISHTPHHDAPTLSYHHARRPMAAATTTTNVAPGGLGPGDAIPVHSSRSRSRSHSPTTLDDADVVDDTSGLVNYEIGDVLYERYKIKSLAGQGTFGTVLHAYDMRRHENVAIKVVRCVRRYLDAAYVEIDILDSLRKSDKDGNSLCVRMRKSFVCHVRRKRHVCLVFEPLGRSLYDFLKRNDFQGFGIKHVREFSYQILQGISFCHRMKLIHTDLKLENVLLCNNEYLVSRRGKAKRHYREPMDTRIRIIDFGGATYNDQHHARMINTRQYRAPEVILGLGWSYPSDLWSIGCMMSELFTGELLFGTHEDAEHLALMERVLDKPIPTSMTKKAIGLCVAAAESAAAADSASSSTKKRSSRKKRSSSLTPADQLFARGSGRLRWPEIASDDASRRHVADVKRLGELFAKHPDLQHLLERLLCYDPDKRITAEEALHHPFFAPIHRRRQQQQQQQQLSAAAAAARSSRSSSNDIDRSSPSTPKPLAPVESRPEGVYRRAAVEASMAAGAAAAAALHAREQQQRQQQQMRPAFTAALPPVVVAPSLTSSVTSPLTSTTLGFSREFSSASAVADVGLHVTSPFSTSGLRSAISHCSRQSARHAEPSLSSAESLYAQTSLTGRNIPQSGDSYVRSPQGHAIHPLDVMRASPSLLEPPRTTIGIARSDPLAASATLVPRPRLMSRASTTTFGGQSGGSDFSDFGTEANDTLSAATMLTNLSSPRTRAAVSQHDRMQYISAGRRSLNDHAASLAERAAQKAESLRARARIQDMQLLARQTFADPRTAQVCSSLSLASLHSSPVTSSIASTPISEVAMGDAMLRATAAAVARQQSAAAMLRLQQQHRQQQEHEAATTAAAAALRSTLARLSRDTQYVAGAMPSAVVDSTPTTAAASAAPSASVSIGVNAHGLSAHFLSHPSLRASIAQADLMLRGAGATAQWPPTTVPRVSPSAHSRALM